MHGGVGAHICGGLGTSLCVVVVRWCILLVVCVLRVVKEIGKYEGK